MWFRKSKSSAASSRPAPSRPVPVRRPAAASDDLDFGGLGQAIWYKKWRIIVPTIVAAALALVVVNTMAPRFKSEARILLETKENAFLRAEADKTDRMPLDAEGVASQIQLLQSRDLARSVIRRENLSENPEFGSARASLVRGVLNMIGIGRNPSAMSAEERVLEAYYDRLNVSGVEKSRVIVVEFSSENPELAARVANAIAETYFSMQQSAKQTQTRAASGWLASEIETMRKKVAEAESKVEEYRARTNLYSGSNNSSLPNQQLTEVNSQISAARAQKADLEARARQLRELLRSGRTIDSSDVSNSESMRRLTEQRTALRSQLAEQSSTLLDQHPRIKELRAQIGEIDAQIRTEGERLARAMENDARVASNRIEALTASLDQVKKLASQSNEQDVQLRALDRESKSQRDLLEVYLLKYREASARENINAAPADARIISAASPAIEPSFPKKGPVVIIVALAVFTLQTLFIVTGELLSPSVMAYPAPIAPQRPEPTVELAPRRRKVTPNAVPVVSPAAKSRIAAITAARPAPSAVHSVEDVAASLREGAQGLPIAVIGSNRNVGTTYSAITLARALATEGKAVLVDMDFNSPNLSVISSDPNAPGIADLAHGAATFGDIITVDQFSPLHIVAAGAVGGDAASLSQSDILADLIDALSQAYDHVVIDVGPAEEADVARIAALAPRAMLVSDNPGRAGKLATSLKNDGFAEVTPVAGGAQAAAA